MHIENIREIIMGIRYGGRQKGTKNAKTLWREAQKLIDNGAIVLDAADPLEILERAMRYFYALAAYGAKHKAHIDDVVKYMREAARLAALAAPYRHPRLSAIANVMPQNQMDGVSPNATAEELRAALAQRIAYLRDQGAVDLDALPPPAKPDGEPPSD